MAEDDTTKAQLKRLRDQLAIEAPRSRTFANGPPEVVRRLFEAAEQVSGVYLHCTAAGANASEALDEVYADALVEGHLALNDWNQWLEQEQQKRKPKPARPAERRESEREGTKVSVKLLRHSLKPDGPSMALDTQTMDRPARNVSSGGIFVVATRTDLPTLDSGHVLHVSVSTSADPQTTYKVRAAITRRDDTGMALRWIMDSPADNRAIEALLGVIRASKA